MPDATTCGVHSTSPATIATAAPPCQDVAPRDTSTVMPRVLVAFALLLVVPRGVPAAVVTSVFNGRIACVEQSGVQFCAGGPATRVESFDGVPLDVSVTLPPASMDGPFPLVVDLHGWSLGKRETPFDAWAETGYVVLSYTARGFHDSCGSPESRAPDATLANPNVCAERGWIRLADVRYEAHDSQHLAGLLADDGLVIPDKVAVTGASYGGGQSMILAALRNRVMQPDGTLVPWKSPGGLDMAIAAAAPLIPWSDLAYSLTPNGRNLDYLTANPYGRRGGVQKQSWNATLYDVGNATGFYSPPGVDFASDIQTWNARVGAGEPYDDDPTLEAILDEITRHHSAYYVDDAVEPAPLFIYNAWTDDLFPVDEAVRFWRKTVAKHPGAEIALLFADSFGHSRATLGFAGAQVGEKVDAFLARHLKGVGEPFPAVEAFTQGCHGAPVEGPIAAPDWDALHPGEVRVTSRRTQRFDGAAGSAATAAATNPLNVVLGPCRTVPADDDPAAATYRLPAAKGDGYTLLGSPTVIADLAVTGTNAQVVARLWDVAPDDTQTLVAQGVYRPRTDNRGPQVFQLHPNGWRFAGGHMPKLELLGQSAPYVRPSNGVFTVTVSTLELRLPVAEVPGGKVVKAPAEPVLPPADDDPFACALAPRTGCTAPAAPRAATVAIGVGARGALDRIDWRWRSSAAAPAAFGDPTAATTYALCVYDGQSRLVASAVAPAGGAWAATGSGFRYAGGKRPTTGVRTVALENGGGETSCKVSGRGTRVGVPGLPVDPLPLTAQLVNVDGACWTSTFAAAKKQTARVLKAVSD
jgi:predicted acyl esterase